MSLQGGKEGHQVWYRYPYSLSISTTLKLLLSEHTTTQDNPEVKERAKMQMKANLTSPLEILCKMQTFYIRKHSVMTRSTHKASLGVSPAHCFFRQGDSFGFMTKNINICFPLNKSQPEDTLGSKSFPSVRLGHFGNFSRASASLSLVDYGSQESLVW